uniref:Putative ixodes 8-cys protein n=1 Tax=Ixodes ricinus TaxID=34613 RepID=A0A0K8RGJ1_IXORI
MLYLRIFILLVLVGLCLGASLQAGDQTSEAQSKEKQTDSKEQGSEDQEENTQSKTLGASLEDQPSGSSPDGGSGSDDQVSKNEEMKGNDENAPALTRKAFDDVVGLPSWISKPKPFMNTLLDKCLEQHYHFERINNETIKWDECKYTCAHHVGDTGHDLPLPEGTPCGPGKKCIKNVCVEDPEVTLPSCR